METFEGAEVDVERVGTATRCDNEDVNLYESKRKKPVRVGQVLLKGDRLFSLNCVDKLGWSSFFRYGQNCKHVTGNVVRFKDWQLGKRILKIVWENQNVEQLQQKSPYVAYGDRLFVLDRECVQEGSKVKATQTPGKVGVVLCKNYLVTGVTVGPISPGLVFEDIPLHELTSYNTCFKNIKILYRGWIGVTTSYRTRLYLAAKESKVEAKYFTVVVDGEAAQMYRIGDEIKLGFSLLRSAEFIGGDTETFAWAVNFVRYYNADVTIMDVELDQLKVSWTGKENTPEAVSIDADAESPSDVITYGELPAVHYLRGDAFSRINPRSLWLFLGNKHRRPISIDGWARAWKTVFGVPDKSLKDDFKPHIDENSLEGKALTMEVMYVRSMVSVKWNDGTCSEVNCGDVVPSFIDSVWSEMLSFPLGSIVRCRLDHVDSPKYGVLSRFEDDSMALVKWITPGSGSEDPTITVSTVSMYNLEKIPEYDFLLKAQLSPIVSASCGTSSKVGTVLGGMKSSHEELCKIPVMLVNKVEKELWPHELTHYKCDVLLCPVQNHWIHWYEDLPFTFPVKCMEDEKRADHFSETCPDSVAVKPRYECVDLVPADNIFIGEEMLLRTNDAEYRYAMQVELEEMQNNLPDGIWVEHYMNRGDIFSAVITGPKETLFEDFMFIFDLFILENFPKSEPHLNFRSMGITILPGYITKSGTVELPEEASRKDEEFTMSYILNVLLEVKDFMALPLEEIHGKRQEAASGALEDDPVELYKFVLLSVLNYTVAVLRNPPENWKSVIFSHYREALPKIAERLKNGYLPVKRSYTMLSNEKDECSNELMNDPPKIDWDDDFLRCINGRLAYLEKVVMSGPASKE